MSLDTDNLNRTNDDYWNQALACVDCNGDKGDRLTPDETMDKALEAGRIETPALRREQAKSFGRRREWSVTRYQQIKPLELPL